MADVTDINETKIRQWFEKKECILIINTKDSSSMWTDLRLVAHKSAPTVPLVGWIACAYCSRTFKSHSDVDKKGKRKNYGLTSAARHVDQCIQRKKEVAAKRKQQTHLEQNKSDHLPSDQLPQSSSTSPIMNKTLTKFLYNKNTLPKTWQNRIKDSECKYVVAGIYV